METPSVGGGGEDAGREAPRPCTSICMPNPLPGSGASGPPSAPQLASFAGWFPSRHRAERAEGRLLPSPCTSHVGGAGEDPAPCRSWWAAHGGQRGVWVEQGVHSCGFLGCCCAPGFPLCNVKGTGHLLAHHGCYPHFNFAPEQQNSPELVLCCRQAREHPRPPAHSRSSAPPHGSSHINHPHCP